MPKHVNLIHVPSHELVPIESLYPFSIWDLNLINAIYPPSFYGNKFLITTTDYFTKWV